MAQDINELGNKFKRFIGMILALVMVLGIMLPGESVVFAMDDEVSKVTEIDIIKNFNGTNLDKIIIKVIGEHVDKSTVHIDVGGNESKILRADDNSTDTFRQYTLTAKEIEELGGIGKEVIITDKAEGTKRYSLGDDHMPTILNVIPASGLIKTNEEVTITGDRLDNIGSNNITGYFKPVGTPLQIDFSNVIKEEDGRFKIVKDVGTQIGKYAVVFEQKVPENVPSVKREHHYLNLFTVYGELNVSDDINMFPNQGAPGTYVTIAGTSLTGNMSAFFLKGETDQYDAKNLAEFIDYRQNADGDKDHYIVKVPQLGQGTYCVVLTNKVEKGQDPKGIINSSKIFENNTFVIISDLNKPTIEEVYPNEGPATGIRAIIRGRFLGSISPNIFKANTGIEPKLTPSSEIDDNEISSDSLVVQYEDNGETVGKYIAIDTADGGVDVVKLERKIRGYIGNPLSFRQGSELSLKGYDTIEVIVPQVTDEKTDPVKDVVLEIETTITYKVRVINGDGTTTEETKEITLTEEVVKPKGFTFEQLGYEPKIISVTPSKIPVYKMTGNNYKTFLDGFKIGIYGENFSIYRYLEKDAEGKDIVKHKYPLVNIGGQIVLDKNKDPNIDIKIFDKNGNEIDGMGGDELGVKILISIPKDLPGEGLGDGFIGTNTGIWVTNPLRNSIPNDMGTTSNAEYIQFVDVETDKMPTIIEITPNTVTTDGEKGVVIIGQNFDRNVKVYMDGEEIKGTKRNDMGTEIVFDAPSKKEGYYQIAVQNEEGGAHTYYPFTYVKTYTDSKIIDFNPKKGTAKTLVTLKGENLVPPNPLVGDLRGVGIWRLIGTRVLLGGKDINEYNMDSDGRAPELMVYTAPDNKPLIYNNKGNLVLSDYYHSLVLEEGQTEKTYYKVYFDTKTGEIKLTDGYKEVYIVKIMGDDCLAVRDGKGYMLDVGDTNLTINLDGTNKILYFKTPYVVKDGIITGNRVKVLNNNELRFEVPPMPKEGYYDVTIVNPDTKKDSKTGNKGFYYSFQPEYNPEIKKIKPNAGSIEGQYYISIVGDRFVETSDGRKPNVIIGTLAVDSKDIEVLPDGKTIRVRVPKYPEDLEKETDMDRKTVAVIVVNPDGGSASMENGFTYIIPISHPRIDRLILSKGSAAGGESVIIEGSGFRFFEPYKDLNNNVEWDKGEPFENLNDNIDGEGEPIWDDLRYWLSPELKVKYDELAEDYENNILPILPKIYFGGKEVTVKGFTASTMEIETPKGTKGPVEVYLVNNDYGTSNKVTFTYEESNPKINVILPGVGRKQGSEKVEITGENFKESKVRVIKSGDDSEEQSLQIVQFGNLKDTNISNRDIPMDATQNSGRIRDNRATVKLGNLTIKYDATQDKRKLNFIIEEGTGDKKAIYNFEYTNYDDTEVFLPVSLLKKESGDTNTQDGDEGSDGEDINGDCYDGYEYVKISLEKITGANTTNRLRVDRGFSPKATLIGAGQITLNTPNYYTVGSIPVTLTNPDGGTATGNFEYKNPDSDPQITNITRDGQQPQLANDGENKILTVNVKGGSIITIEGRDFRDVRLIQIGNILNIGPGDVLEEGSDKLVFKMPPVGDDALTFLHRVVITNEDGGTASSDAAVQPIYIQFIKGESNPQIESIVPPRGSSTGGNTVIINGKDFRETMEGYNGEKLKVYFDGKQVPEKDVEFIDYKTISVTAPPGVPGSVEVKVENPDGEMSNIAEYTYASNPRITSVVDPLDPTGKAVISIVSIEGNQEIGLKGMDFMEGATVYFAPKVIPVTGNEGSTGKIIYIEGIPHILEEGTEGTEYNFIDNETVTIKTPPLKVGSSGVIIVNSDGGASPIYTSLTYGLPEIATPSWIAAELVYDRFIRVHWGAVSGVTEYEIFVVIGGRTAELIGSTGLTSFAYSDLQPRTSYRFIVKAVGNFGSSKPSMESNTVKTGKVVGPPDEDGGLAEGTSMTKTGDVVSVVIGTKDKGIAPMVIDLTEGSLAGSTGVVISMPASVIVQSGNRNVQVMGKDFLLNFRPSAFNTAIVKENSTRSDAGVRFIIAPDKGNTQIASGNGLSTVYNLDATIYVGKANTAMDYLAGPLSLALNYDLQKANLRKLNYAGFSHFNPETNSWQSIGSPTDTVVNHVSGTVNRLGRYAVIGGR